jgi:hypothetical protein
MNDKQGLLGANLFFYEAFEAMDMDMMSEAWSHSESAVCIHPGWERLNGWPQIRESWRAIFANTGFMRFEPTDIAVQIIDNIGCINCVENIFTVVDGMTIHSRVAGTNIFTRSGTGWRLQIHHGSGIAESQTIQVTDAEISH